MSKPKFPPRNPMPKTFTAIVPLSLKAASETYQFSPRSKPFSTRRGRRSMMWRA
jgi:hypothetical protein